MQVNVAGAWHASPSVVLKVKGADANKPAPPR
jgi:hypothetical protein